MNTDHPELDEMQRAYKEAVELWITTIRKEEELASTNHSITHVDRWEQAHFDEEAARDKVKTAKSGYEAALRLRAKIT